jgi:glycosyltransferase involved in cell wall biosynthesis
MRPPPLRVVYVVGYYADLTGSQRSLLAFLRAVDPADLRALVVFPGEGRCVEAYRRARVRTLVLAAPAALDRFGGAIPRASAVAKATMAARDLVPYAARFARVLARERADLAHFNDLRALLLAGSGAVLRPTPRIWHLRGDGRAVGAAHHAGAAMADRIVCVADAVRETVPRWARARAVTVYNGVDAGLGPPDRTRAALVAALDGVRQRDEDRARGGGVGPGGPDAPGTFLALMVGTLVPFKGAHHLIDALGLLEERDGALAARVRLVLVGDAPVPAYRELLERRIARLRRARVSLAGWDPSPLDWMRAADLVVLPTVRREALAIDGAPVDVEGTEGFPRTVLEAMACARPVVATRVMGVAEQVDHGATGFLCPPSDPGALALAVERVVRMSSAERERLGAAGRARVVERFSIARNVEATLAVYRELLARR